MPTQDFIAPKKIDTPRHDQNMPEGVETPAPKSWRADRPGDQGQRHKEADNQLLGNAGPNGGYALTLAVRHSKDLILTDHEHNHDVEILLAEIAMRRASSFGRAPIAADIEFAAHLFSYDIQSSQGIEKWRPRLVHGVGHDEHARRLIVNSVPDEIIQGTKGEIHSSISGWWEKLEGLI